MLVKRPLAMSVILVVEDDAFVRMYAVEMLEDAGFAVVEANDADEAWVILGARHDIGVLFTDIDMPGSMCGFTLSRRVAVRYPTIRLVLTSGRQRFSDTEMPNHGLFVPKPYGLAQVVDAIDAAR